MVGAKCDRVGIDSVKLSSEQVTVHILFTMALIICIEIGNLFLSEFNRIIFHFIEKKFLFHFWKVVSQTWEMIFTCCRKRMLTDSIPFQYDTKPSARNCGKLMIHMAGRKERQVCLSELNIDSQVWKVEIHLKTGRWDTNVTQNLYENGAETNVS